MTEEEFSNIFIRPLYKLKFSLSKIDKSIYNEIIDLSNRFCIPFQVLDNLIYDQEVENPLINHLKEQVHISNLKKLINQKELLKIAKIFDENAINYVFLKGSAINELNNEYIRYSRDLDILVNKKSLNKAYKLMKEIGYIYHDPLVSDCAKFTSNSYTLPLLSNREGSLVEIHHRVTDLSIYKECPLTESMLKEFSIICKNGVNVNISQIDYLIAHLVYHAALHHKFDMGPVFLYDIHHLINKIDNKKEMENLLQEMNLYETYKNINKYLSEKSVIDIFRIYKMSNIKAYNKKTPKKFRYLLFTKNGRSDFLKIISRKFTKNEDLYQTSKYSLKFYYILFVEFKNHCMRLLKN